MSNIDDTLQERGLRYGQFADHAEITQHLKHILRAHPGWSRLAPDQTEAIEMVMHKVSRILNGDPNYIDSWHDIGGYVRLVEQRLEQEAAATLQKKSDAYQAKVAEYAAKAASYAAKAAAAPTNKAAEDEACTCAACVIRAKFEGLFPGAQVEVIFLGEESGLIG